MNLIQAYKTKHGMIIKTLCQISNESLTRTTQRILAHKRKHEMRELQGSEYQILYLNDNISKYKLLTTSINEIVFKNLEPKHDQLPSSNFDFEMF